MKILDLIESDTLAAQADSATGGDPALFWLFAGLALIVLACVALIILLSEKNTPSIARILAGLGGDEFSHRAGFQHDK